MSDAGPRSPVMAKPAATVVLLREGRLEGVEAYFMRRPAASSFAPDAYVFPGGAVEPEDGDDGLLAGLVDFDVDERAARMGFDAGDDGRRQCLAYHVAAVRELFEETGLFLGTQRDATALGGDHATVVAAARGELVSGGSLRQIIERSGLRLGLGQLVYAAHFVSPLDYPKRFDVRFFVARCPGDQVAAVHAPEAVEGGWHPPEAILSRHAQGELKLMPPTRVMCARIATANDIEEVIDDLATSPVEPPRREPTTSADDRLDRHRRGR